MRPVPSHTSLFQQCFDLIKDQFIPLQWYNKLIMIFMADVFTGWVVIVMLVWMLSNIRETAGE
jgi:hypothetical protein